MATVAASGTPPAVAGTGTRVASVDIIRGVVMVLMAVDHVRVYSGLPAGGATFGLFFTRWITHFCAPVFLFLAGTSAFLAGQTRADLSRYLLIRGVWLVVLELTFFRVAWTFNVDFANYQMAGVIWLIGWCMILMAGFVKLPIGAIGLIGIVMITAHNLLDSYVGTLLPTLEQDSRGALWKILYVGFFAGPIQLGPDGSNLIVLYTIVPWIGVMAAGYAFGGILTMEAERRRRLCLTIGLGAVALFIVLRGFNLYGDPRPWAVEAEGPDGSQPMPAPFAFLNTTKYPASFLFLLMTLGPVIALIPLLEGPSTSLRTGRPTALRAVVRWLTVFGRVPLFFYLLHIPLIHALALAVSKIRLGAVSPWLFANHPMGNPPPPDGYAWSLPLLYLVWGLVILILYFPCRWLAAKKMRHGVERQV